jgi:superfamily II DNA or RNA helicase
MTRDERQTEVLKAWIAKQCRGTIVAATGFGKTRVALRAIKWFLSKNSGCKVMVVVPTLYLKTQWTALLIDWSLKEVEVRVINSVIKQDFIVDFLIIDECHAVAADLFSQIFRKVDYKIVMGLTATFERLDGKEALVKKYAPICAEVPLTECIANKWLAPFREYKVLLDVDLTTYKNWTIEFMTHFSFFDFDFELAMSMLGKKGNVIRRGYAKKYGLDYKDVDLHTFGFSRALQGRKQFIFNHPFKTQITQEILAFRSDCKAITFSQSIEMAKAVGVGEVIHSKLTPKNRVKIEEDFNKATVGVLNSVRTIELGADIDGVNLAIILCGTSSAISSYQRKGRALRLEGDKTSEIFHLILRGTVEEEWFRKASKNADIITIDEEQLKIVLNNDEIEDKVQKENKFLFRY